MSNKPIQVVPYDPNWPKIFDIEAEKIKIALGATLAEIHHVGSTSVPGLAAKEDIDIVAVIKKDDSHLLDDQPQSRQAQYDLEKIGYKCKGEFNVPMRYFFSKNTDDSKVNLHVVEQGHGFIDLQLSFRDYLRENAHARDEYSQLKYDILQNPASLHRCDTNFGMPAYTLKKNAFIKRILKLAGFDGVIMNRCLFEEEWKEYSRIAGSINIVPNIKKRAADSDNHHFVLYKGVDIVSIANVEIVNADNAVLKFLAIDAQYKDLGFEKCMMSSITKHFQGKRITINPYYVRKI